MRDDRGQPVTLGDLSALRSAIYNHKPPFPWRRLFAWTIFGVKGSWMLLSLFDAIAPKFSMFFIGLLFPLLPFIAWRRAGRAATITDDQVSCSTLVHIGHCGGCGFPLHELAPAPDGCVTCPECGAAWHRDRWRRQRPDAVSRAQKRIDAPPQRHSDRSKVDDRATPLASSLVWEPSWYGTLLDRFTRDTIAPEHWKAASDFYAECSAELRRLRIRYTLWCLGGMCGLMAMTWAAGISTESPDVYVLIILMTLIALAFAVFTAKSNIDTRSVALGHSLCPSCGEVLNLTQPRQFDGCIQCAKCAAAWKMAPTSENPHAGDANRHHPTSASPSAAP